MDDFSPWAVVWLRCLVAALVLAWLAVGIPLAWGVWKTLESAAKIL